MKCTRNMLIVLLSSLLSIPALATCPSADLTADCRVDFADFAVLSSQWLEDGLRPVAFATFLLDTDPNWTTGGQWQFGVPMGMGGSEHGYPDPNRGYTGQNVYGVNLSGDYATTVGGPYSLTAGPFDCSGYQIVLLAFAGWLNTDMGDFVRCSVEVTNNGSMWHTVWQNPVGAQVTDNQWYKVSYDISQATVGHATVYIRWSHQVVRDRAFSLSGWNIDDVEISGLPATTPDEWLVLYLAMVRTAIASYKTEHNNGLPGSGTANFYQALTMYTDITGALAAVQAPGPGVYGPYLQEIPTNPFTNDDSVGIDGTVGDASNGWNFDSTTGDFRADDTEGTPPHNTL